MKKVTVLLALLCLASFSWLHAQTRQITGTVTTSEDGSALPGVSVAVVGTSIGVITNVDGKYVIPNVPMDAKFLEVRFVGFETQRFEIGERSVMDFVLTPASIALDEVVVTAIGIKREKREITYQTQKVGGEDLTTVTPVTAASALAGKVAGLQINVQNNGVKPSTQILLRGLRSISSSNSALIVIDGSIASQSAFDNLNPSDIADISVLKGATAAALYGSKAGNGALIVTTKSGEGAKRFTVGINASYTAEKVAYMPDFQTEYGTGWGGLYDNVENTNWGPRFDGTLRQIGPTMSIAGGDAMDTQIVPYAPVKDNLLNFYETGQTFTETVYLTGSTDDSKFYVSIGDQKTAGIVLYDEYHKNTFRVNASKKMGDVELKVNANYFKDQRNVVGNQIGDQDRTLYWFVLNQSANIPLSTYKDWDNPLSYGYADNYYNAYYQNPYWAVGTNRDMDYTNRLNANFNMSWDILDFVNFTARTSMNNSWGNGKNWRAYQDYDPHLQPWHSTVSSFVEDTEFQTSTFTTDAMLTGDFEFMDSFTLKTIVGATNYMNEWRNSYIRANNLSIPGFYDISNGTGSLDGTVDYAKYINVGVFTDLTFGYNNYLFLNFSGRQDWVSSLSKENRSYFYPSVGLSFVATDAFEVLKTGDILTTAKFTLGNSTVYNDFAAYQINERFYQAGGFPYGSINGFFLGNQAVDSNIKKEKLNTTEVGMNLLFLRGRMWFDASWYKTITSDLITQITPSISSGATGYLTNIGQLSSTGVELTFGGSVLKFGDFKWDLNLNYSTSTTIVDEIIEGVNETTVSATGQYGVFAIVGKPFPYMKANDYQYTDDGKIIVDPNSGYPLEADGLQEMGRVTPKHIIGLNSLLSFKGFSVSATVDYRTGHVYYEQGSASMEFTGRSMASVSSNRQDFVIPNSVIETSPGVYEPNTNIAITGGNMNYWKDIYNEVRSNYVKDASALKVREFSVNYEVPKNLISKLPISKVVVGFIARNPLTYLPEENRFSDPEFNNTLSNAIGIGGYFQSPPTKSYGFSLNIEF